MHAVQQLSHLLAHSTNNALKPRRECFRTAVELQPIPDSYFEAEVSSLSLGSSLRGCLSLGSTRQ